MKIAIIDYAAGNVQSIKFALKRIGHQGILTADPNEIFCADKVIFPGVGEAETAMNRLRERELDQLIPTLKQPSPFTNPVNQKGFISWYPAISTSGLRTGVLFGKATLKVSLKPLFRFAFKDTSLSNPSCVKCDLLIIRSYANLNKA